MRISSIAPKTLRANKIYNSSKNSNCCSGVNPQNIDLFKKHSLNTNSVYYKPLNINFNGSYTASILLEKLGHNYCEPSVLFEAGLLSDLDKDEFIKQYCDLTGFPDLKSMNKNMKNHAREAILKSSKNACTKVLWSGYHNSCSVSYDFALSGSDLDATGIIVDGQQEDIDRLKGELWRNVNPLLVSERKDFETPDVYSIDQLYEWTKLIDEIVKKEGLDKKEAEYKQNMLETKDYERALEFNIDIAQGISKYSKEELKNLAPSVSRLLSYGETPKNITQSMSSCLESLRSGKALIELDDSSLSDDKKEKLRTVRTSYLYKYGNICMQDAKYEIKDKLLKRAQLINKENFSKMSKDEKFNLVLKMIYESYPSWSKAKINFINCNNELFENTQGTNELKNRAFRKATGS